MLGSFLFKRNKRREEKRREVINIRNETANIRAIKMIKENNCTGQ